MIFRKWGGGGQRPFGIFPKIHPFWWGHPSLNVCMYTIFLEISSILNQEAKKIYSEELMNCSFSRCWVGHTVWAAEGRNQASNGRQLVNQKVFQKCLKSVTKNDLKKCPQKCEPKKVLQKNLPKKYCLWLDDYEIGFLGSPNICSGNCPGGIFCLHDITFFNFDGWLWPLFALQHLFQLVALVNHVCRTRENQVLHPPPQVKFPKTTSKGRHKKNLFFLSFS